MKKIINNKIYDTEKCDIIYTFRKNYPIPCLFIEGYQFNNFIDTQILRTKKGTYLEYCKEKNILNIVNEKWVKDLIKRLDADKYIELFGKLEEG